jgi:hypothetical protein
MDALREWGVLAGNAGWKTLFSRICAEHGVEPSFRRKNAEGETDSNARVGFEQPEIPTKPAKKVTAAVKQIDYSAIAAATRAMSTPKMGGMGDIS